MLPFGRCVIDNSTADENPKWLAAFIDKNAANAGIQPSAVDLSYLDDQLTMI